jgi:ABC-type dipeptide/oligopeptide/nickel transport system permease component
MTLGFLLRRILGLAGVLFCAISITFFLVRLLPGGPFSSERKLLPHIEQQLNLKYKLEGPQGRAAFRGFAERLHQPPPVVDAFGNAGSLAQQYIDYWGDLLRGDLRISTKYRDRSVNELLADSLPVTMTIGAIAFVLALIFGVGAGVIAAARQNTLTDAGVMTSALLTVSIPTFVIGPLLIFVFALTLRILPVGGLGSWQNLLLPAVTLAAPYAGYVARLMRASMLDTLTQDFVRTALAKGLRERAILLKHALRVAALPVVSYAGPLAAHLLTGSLVIEMVFNLPGSGQFFVNGILNQDGFLVGGVVIIYCVLLLVMNTCVDIAYSLLDRRVKLDG